MMNFTYTVPTKIHFGKGQLPHLAELREYGDKVLLVYGGGSIKRSGLYDDAMAVLKDAGITVYELPGIEPNPRIQSVRKGVEMCKAEGIAMVLAIGGGSTIDAAKVIAAGAVYDDDAWDLVLNPGLIKGALPIFSVLTLAATGSEMDMVAVISDMTKNEKWGTRNPHLLPTMSILDPTYTYSVSKKQTAAGTADMMSHTMENYFSMAVGAEIQTQFAEGILRTCIKYGPIALAEPDNYEARANLMWAAPHAINGLCRDGLSPGWCIHPMEHELSAFYDITHGEGLAILTPVWMEFLLRGKAAAAPMGSDAYLAVMRRLARFGRNVFGLDAARRAQDVIVAESAVLSLKSFFFETLGIPATLSAVGITEEDNFEVMAEKAVKNAAGWYVPLTADEVVEIFRAAK